MPGWRGTYNKGERKGAPTVGIRDRLAAHDARLVTVSELLTAFTNAEGITPQEVVRALYVDNIPNSVPIRILYYSSDTYGEGGKAGLSFELERAANGGKAQLSADAECDLHNGKPGFLREELVAALKSAGWSVPRSLIEPITSTDALDNHSNLLPFVPRVNISLREAADLLAEANGGEWWATLEDAADSGLIQSGSWSEYRGDQQLTHADIRAWCEESGVVWPVPRPAILPGATPAPEASLPDNLAAISSECQALRGELDAVIWNGDALRAELAAVTKERDHARARSAELDAEVAQLRAELETIRLQGVPAIRGDTFAKLTRVMGEFPAAYPNPSRAKLDQDIRPWIKRTLSRCSDREMHVFGSIIAEHFGLKA